MSQRVLALIDDIWRLVRNVSHQTDNGSIQVELNGYIITVKRGYWIFIDGNGYNEEIIEQILVEKNLYVLVQKAAVRKLEESRKKSTKKVEEPAEPLVVGCVDDTREWEDDFPYWLDQ